MLGLHRVVNYRDQIVLQGIQVRLVAEFGVESRQSPGRIVLLAVETPVHERLDAATQGVEEGCYRKSRGHDSQLRLLAGEEPESILQ